jgi:hypothetical protein
VCPDITHGRGFPRCVGRGTSLAWILLPFLLAGCGPRGGAAQNPASPAPVADPAAQPGTLNPAPVDPATKGAGGLPDAGAVPVRPDQAPLVRIAEALTADSLLGRRVRVLGRCTAAGTGRRAGSWTLEEDGSEIEVRGLVPYSCGPTSTGSITIFAQIEPKTAGSSDRLLLRLPD